MFFQAGRIVQAYGSLTAKVTLVDCINESGRRIHPSGSPREIRTGPVFYPALSGEEECWFALYVQVNHEREVTRRLEQREIECYMPLMECWSKRRDRRKKILLPVFPGYLFVRAVLDNYTNVHILKTPGALSILRNSEGPIPVPDYQIDSLKTLLGTSEPLQPHHYLNDGDWVVVIRGALAGCRGILLRQDRKKGRLVVSIDIIRQAVSVQLNVEDVEPTSPPKPALWMATSGSETHFR